MLARLRAALVHAFDTDPVVEDVPEPERQSGEALVDVLAAPVGHIDLTVLRGTFAHRPPLPYVPGTDAAGTVVASEIYAPGTRVRVRGAGLGLSRDGTWRARITAPDEAIHAVPPGVDVVAACVCFSSVATAYMAVNEVGRVERGERVAVTGATGAVGSLSVQLALRAGADSVYGIVGTAEKAAALAPTARAVVGSEPLPEAVDVLIDTVGGPRLPDRIASVRRRGRVVLVGYTAGTELRIDLPRFLAGEVTLSPLSMLERRLSDELTASLLREIGDGVLRLPFEIRPLTEVATAIADVRSGRVVGRVALDPAQ